MKKKNYIKGLVILLVFISAILWKQLLPGKAEQGSLTVLEFVDKVGETNVVVEGDNIQSVSINNSEDLIYLSNVNAQYYQHAKIEFIASTLDLTSTTNTGNFFYKGLGSEAFPFTGTLSSNANLGLEWTISTALFNAVDSSVQQPEMSSNNSRKIIYKGEYTGIIAEQVIFKTDTNTQFEWDMPIEIDGTPSGIIYKIVNEGDSQHTVTLGMDFDQTNKLPVVVIGKVSAGFICGELGDNITIDISQMSLPQSINVTAEENAGGLIGTMEESSKVIAQDVITFNNLDISGGQNVGGLVGEANSPSIITNLSTAPNINITKVLVKEGETCGGIYGTLKNNTSITIDGSYSFGTILYESKNADMIFGGLIGRYQAIKPDADLIISNVNNGSDLVCEQNKTTLYYGGIIGQVDNYSYVNIDDIIVAPNTSQGEEPKNKGGLIGYVGEGSVANIGNVSIKSAYQVAEGGFYGGIAGIVQNDATVKLYEKTTVEGQSQVNKNYGRIVGKLMWALVYADADWDIIETGEASQIDNIGTNGDVIRNDKIGNIITFNDGTNQVTVEGVSEERITTNQTISSKPEFAKLAIALQTKSVNEGTLKFDIDFRGNVDLTGTGIYGLTRNDSANATQRYQGHVNGHGNTVTLDIGGDIEGKDNKKPGRGVFTKENLGLFGVITGDTIFYDFIVDGNINIKQNSTNVNFGALAGLATGNISNTVQLSRLKISPQIGFSCSKATLYGGSAIGQVQNMNVNIGGKLDTDSTDSIDCKVELLGASIKNTGNLQDNKCEIGGFIGNIKGVEQALNSRVSIEIEDLTINETSITMNNNISTFGGLLGNKWTYVDVSIKNSLVVKGSNIDTMQSGIFGGLIYSLDGSFIQKNTANIFISNTKIYNNNGNKTELENHKGLIIGDANLAYISIHMEKYILENNKIETKGNIFDEIAGYNLGGLDSTNKESGIISICTGNQETVFYNNKKIKMYKSQLSEIYKSNGVRYYYNLENILGEPSVRIDNSNNGPDISDYIIDNIEELMLWSVRNFSKVGRTYWGELENTTYTISGDIDTTGYSYYPTTSQTKLKIEEASIIFDNETINTLCSTGYQKEIEDNRNTAYIQGNHYRMHGGILYTQKKNLVVSDLTLKGSISNSFNKDTGALICGSISGTSLENRTEVMIKDIKLGGIKVYDYDEGTSLSALLIHKIGSYVNIDISGVKTDIVAEEDSYEVGEKVAASLICYIGGSDDEAINIIFSDIALNGKKESSIFSTASFAYSFAYAGGSTGIYNFTYDQAWKDGEHIGFYNVTYGKEITQSLRNPEEQKQYYNSNYFVHTTQDPGDESVQDAEEFSDYLPYIYCGEEGSYKELDVNLKKADLIEGNGTYEKPYRITNPRQLQLVSQEVPPDEWVICIENNNQDAFYQWSNGKWIGGRIDSNNSFISDSNETITEENVREYLLNAYYQIESSITMTANYEGLGTVDAPFKGVIIGKENIVVKYPLKPKTHIQFGGLIKVSQGAVVKDLTIELGNKVVEKTSIQQSGTEQSKGISYFGGVIGTILGGDNIIDNVVIEQQNDSTVSIKESNNKYEKYASVGGYVGLIQNGGVIFKNIPNDTNISDNTQNIYTKFPSDSYFYTNPYVGRVLDGFAINTYNTTKQSTVKTVLDNGKDDYQIPTILENQQDKVLKVELNEESNSGQITVVNEDGLYLLSAIVNSGAGSYNNTTYLSAGYASSKVRNGNYNSIGKNPEYLDPEAIIDDIVSNDKNKIPYLIKNYTNKVNSSYPATKLANINSRFDINFTSALYDMIPLGNGFRGIGARYQQYNNNEFRNRILHVGDVNRENSNQITIKYNMDVKQYTYTTKNENDCFLVKSMGLFNYFMQDGMYSGEKEKIVSNLKISGTNCFSRENVLNDNRILAFNSQTSQGMLIGSMYSNLGSDLLTSYQSCFSNISIFEVKMSGGAYTGGVIGNINTFTGSNKSIYNIKINKSTVQKYEICSWGIVGAILGNVGQTKISITNIDITNANHSSRDYIQGKIAGGVIGSISSNQGVILQGCRVGTPYSNNNDKQSLLFTGLDNQNGIILGGVIGKVTKNVNAEFILTDASVDNVAISRPFKGTNKTESCVGGIYGDMTGASYVMERIKLTDNIIIGQAETGGAVGRINANSGMYIHNIQWKNNILGNDLTESFNVVNWLDNVDIDRSVYNIVLKNSDAEITYANMTREEYQFNNIGVWVGTIDQNANPLYITDATLEYQTEVVNEEEERQVALLPMRSVGNKENRNKNPENSTGIEIGNEFKGYIQYDPKENIEENSEEDILKDLSCNSVRSPIQKLEELYKNRSNNDYLRDYNFSYNYFYEEGEDNQEITDIPQEVSGQFITFNEFHNLDIDDGDFPVLVVESSDSKEVTAMLKGYLDLILENGFSEVYYSSGYKRQNAPKDIQIKSYKLKDYSTPSLQEESVASLEYVPNSSEYFRIVPGQWDNGNQRVTVIELSYNIQTLNTDGNVVDGSHIVRIPIVVKQIVHVAFSATVQEGTNFNLESYANISQKTLSNYGDKYTTLLEYRYTDYDWIGYLESGGSLLWNYEKKIEWGGELPKGSQLTLIDLNNSNQVYTYEITEDNVTSVELKDFKQNLSQDMEQSMQIVNLNTLLNLKAEEDINGKWIATSESNGAVSCGNQWYCLATEEQLQDETTKYTIQLPQASFVPTEQYYLTVKTPKVSQTAESGLGITYKTTFGHSSTPEIQQLPYEIELNKDVKRECVIYQAISQCFINSGKDNTILLDSKGDTVTLEYTNNISCSKDYYDFIKNGGERFVELSLAPVLKTLTSENNVAFTAPIDATVQFEVTNSNPGSISREYNVTYSQPLNEMRFILGDGTTAYNIVKSFESLSDGLYGCTVKTTITLNIPEVAMDMFPYSKSDDESGNISEYIRFNAQSKIAIQEESFKSKEGTKCDGTDKYYRNLLDMASLHYSVNDKETDLGVNSLNLEQPGEPQHISTLAVYNTELISKATWDKVTEIECELTLYNKSDEQREANKMIPYTEVDVDGNSEWLGKYLTIKLQDSEGKGMEKALTASNFTVEGTNSNNFAGYYHPDSQQLVLPLELYVTPNLSNINDKYKYSNYMVALHVTLWGANKQIIVPEKTDYIRYTHANIPKRIIRTLAEIN